MEASDEDKLPESEVLGQVVSHSRNKLLLLTRYSIDVVRTLDCLSGISSHVHIVQTSTLTFAATDTTSNALSRTVSLLASHPEVQEKVRQEILDALEKNGGQDFSYDELVSLPLLDAVCRETLRL
jgi:Cytochrome P450